MIVIVEQIDIFLRFKVHEKGICSAILHAKYCNFYPDTKNTMKETVRYLRKLYKMNKH